MTCIFMDMYFLIQKETLKENEQKDGIYRKEYGRRVRLKAGLLWVHFCSCVPCLQNDHQFFPSLSGWPPECGFTVPSLKVKSVTLDLELDLLPTLFQSMVHKQMWGKQTFENPRACCWEPLCTTWESLSLLPGGGETRLKKEGLQPANLLNKAPRTHQWGHPTESGANWNVHRIMIKNKCLLVLRY